MITGSSIICYEGCPLNEEKVTLRSMCLLTIAYQQHSQAPLIIASNRDEFYARPTLPMHWWQDAPILAGRDQQAMGTWLGLSNNGRFAAVTNYRQVTTNNSKQTALLSRGSLVSDFLSSDQTSHQWSQTLVESGADFDGFNLLTYDGKQLVYCNNHNNQPPQVLSSGFYALSNGALDSDWPKVDHARDQLRQLLRDGQAEPAATGILHLGLLALAENFEETGQVLGAHSDTCILHTEAQHILAVTDVMQPDAQRYCTLHRKLDGIRQQVENDLAQPHGVADGVFWHSRVHVVEQR